MIDKQQLLKSNHFCILPFMSTRIWHGMVVPCCVNNETIFGYSTETPINEIYSPDNPILTNFRKELVQGPALPKTCSRCIDCEASGVESNRQSANVKWASVIDNLDFNEDGYLAETKFYLWDGVGYTNLCNLKCRMCPSFLSSSTREEEIKYNLEVKAGSPTHAENFKKYLLKHQAPKMTFESFNDIDDFYELFNQHIEYVEDIKFEGGEPLMMEHHYQILELLIEKNKTNVALNYPTNLTRLTLKNYNVLELWNHFKTVNVTVSIDAYNDQNYYIRHPSNWQDIVDNIEKVKTHCPHVNISVSTTMQVLNSFAATKLHKWTIENNIQHNFPFLKYPSYLSMHILPTEYKQQVEQHWNEHKKTLSPNVDTSQIDGFLRMMWAEDRQEELPEFFTRIEERDIIRKENLLVTFPELTELKKYD